MKVLFKSLVRLSFITVSAYAASGFAQEESSSLPPVQSQDQTQYITGGVGEDESKAILQAANSWPLTLELSKAAAPRAEYISDAQITIKDKSGKTVLDMTAEGPYVLVKLPPGKYSLDAAFESKTLHRNIILQKRGSKRVSLMWPATPD